MLRTLAPPRALGVAKARAVAPRAFSTTAARPDTAAPDTGLFHIPEAPIPIEHAPPAADAAPREAPPAARGGVDTSAAHERQVRRMRQAMVDDLAPLASTQTRQTSFRPFKLRTQPVDMASLTLSHLLASGAQMGHAKYHVQRSYEPWLYGYRHGQAVIDVERATLPALRRAVQVVRQVAENDGIILVVGTKPWLRAPIRSAMARFGSCGFHVSNDRWMPGVLTNAATLLSSATQYSMQFTHDLENSGAEVADPSEDSLPTPTELASKTYRPDLMIVLNPRDNVHALREATQCNVPTMAIVDTNVDPRSVTYAIPANDDAPRVAELVLGVLSHAASDGLRRRQLALEASSKRGARRRPRAAPAA